MKKYLLIFISNLFVFYQVSLYGQSKLSINEVLDIAIKKSPYLHYYYLDLEKQQFSIQSTSINLNPEISFKIANKNTQAISIRQDINIRDIVYQSTKKNFNSDIELSKNKYLSALQKFKRDILMTYLKAQYQLQLNNTFKQQDTLINEIVFKYSKAKSKLSTAYHIIVDNTLKEIYANVVSSELSFLSTIKTLKGMTDIEDDEINIDELKKLDYPEMYLNENVNENSIEKAKYDQSINSLKLTKTMLVPNLFLKWNNSLGQHTSLTPEFMSYFELGISIPLFLGKYNKLIQEAKFNTQIYKEKLRALKYDKWKHMQAYLSDINSIEIKLNTFDNVLLNNANKLIAEANKIDGFSNNNLVQILDLINKAFTIRINYIEELYNYNKAVINAKFINNNL